MTRGRLRRAVARHHRGLLAVGATLYLLHEGGNLVLGGSGPVELAVQATRIALVGALVTAMAVAWRHRKADLAGAETRVAELERALDTAHAREESARRALERSRVAREEEQRLLAYDVHDGVAQPLVSAKQHLDTFQDLWRQRDDRAARELEHALDRLGRAILETRLLLATLPPAAPESLGLVPALRTLLDEASRRGGWTFAFQADLGGAALSPAASTAIYRIVEEAVRNVNKHARAASVQVEIRREAGQVLVEVRDRGIGFARDGDPSRAAGLGLAGMRERARLLGGALRVESVPAVGTSVRVTLPIGAGGE